MGQLTLLLAPAPSPVLINVWEPPSMVTSRVGGATSAVICEPPLRVIGQLPAEGSIKICGGAHFI